MIPPSFFPFADLTTCKLFVQCPSGLVGQIVAVYGGVTPALDDALALVVVLDGTPKMALPAGFVAVGVATDFCFAEGLAVVPVSDQSPLPVASGPLPPCLHFTGGAELSLAGANGAAMELTPESGVLVRFSYGQRS